MNSNNLTAKCNDYLTLDGSTLGNLEILRNEEGLRRGTLIEFVDQCRTKFGKRMMEQWLKAPLNKLDAINERLDAVDYLIEDETHWNEVIDIQSKLSKLADLERILHHLAVLGTKGRKMDRAVLFEKCWNEAKVAKLEAEEAAAAKLAGPVVAATAVQGGSCCSSAWERCSCCDCCCCCCNGWCRWNHLCCCCCCCSGCSGCCCSGCSVNGAVF